MTRIIMMKTDKIKFNKKVICFIGATLNQESSIPFDQLKLIKCKIIIFLIKSSVLYNSLYRREIYVSPINSFIILISVGIILYVYILISKSFWYYLLRQAEASNNSDDSG